MKTSEFWQQRNTCAIHESMSETINSHQRAYHWRKMLFNFFWYIWYSYLAHETLIQTLVESHLDYLLLLYYWEVAIAFGCLGTSNTQWDCKPMAMHVRVLSNASTQHVLCFADTVWQVGCTNRMPAPPQHKAPRVVGLADLRLILIFHVRTTLFLHKLLFKIRNHCKDTGQNIFHKCIQRSLLLLILPYNFSKNMNLTVEITFHHSAQSPITHARSECVFSLYSVQSWALPCHPFLSPEDLALLSHWQIFGKGNDI